MILKPKPKETPEQELQRLREEMARMAERIAELAPAAPAPADPADIPDEELAVITAAVYASLGTNVTIQAIRQTATRTWAAQGRALIQSLRNLRIKPRSHR